MFSQNRREFIRNTTTLGIAAALLPAVGHAAEKPRFTVGLSQYSLRAMFKDKSLDPLDYAQYAVDTFGIKAIDLWEGGLPGDKLNDKAYLGKLKERATQAGSDLFLLMTGPLDANPQKKDGSVKSLKSAVDRAMMLGCDFLRVFLRAPGKDEAAGVKASVEALKPLSDYAAEKKVMIAIEPGASVLSQKGAFLAKVAKALNHDACKLMPDFGKLKNNVYDGTEAMLPYTVTVSAKMHSFDADGNQPDFDYVRLMKMIVESEYKGYIAIEWEGKKLKPVKGVKASQALIKKSLAANGVIL